MKLIKKLEEVINFSKADAGVALGTLLALTVMIYHTTVAFYVESREGMINGFFGSLFAISVDFAVLVFTLRGNPMSHIFSIFQIVMNLIHFGEIQNTFWYDVSFGSWIISLSLPLIISTYSYEVNKKFKLNKIPFSDEKPKLSEEKDFIELKEELQSIWDEVQTLNTDNIQLNDQREKVVKHLNELNDRTTTLELFKDVTQREIVEIQNKATAAVETLRNFRNNSSENRNLYSPKL